MQEGPPTEIPNSTLCASLSLRTPQNSIMYTICICLVPKNTPRKIILAFKAIVEKHTLRGLLKNEELKIKKRYKYYITHLSFIRFTFV